MGDELGGRPADAVIVGGGLSGHYLARALVGSHWGSAARSVIVDPPGAALSGRRWAYWSPDDEPEAWRVWDRLHVPAAGRDVVVAPRRHRYLQVRGEDLDAASRRLWGGAVEVVVATATAIDDRGEFPVVTTDAGPIRGRWVFDAALGRARRAGMTLWFAGEVRRHDGDDPASVTAEAPATIIDDRLPPHDGFGFGYRLPLGGGEEFVEVTRFASARPEHLDADLAAFGQRGLSDGPATVLREAGALALGRPPRSRRRSRRVLTIGAAAGAVRASTGYGFTRIRADAAAIAESLDRDGHPFGVPRLWPRRHVLADAVLLNLLQTDPAAGAQAFAALFARVDPDVLLDFLDAATSLRQERDIVAAVPQGPFRRAAAACLIRGGGGPAASGYRGRRRGGAR